MNVGLLTPQSDNAKLGQIFTAGLKTQLETCQAQVWHLKDATFIGGHFCPGICHLPVPGCCAQDHPGHKEGFANTCKVLFFPLHSLLCPFHVGMTGGLWAEPPARREVVSIKANLVFTVYYPLTLSLSRPKKEPCHPSRVLIVHPQEWGKLGNN